MARIPTLQRRPCSTVRAQRAALGFTITETMLAVAVLAILVGLAAPGFKEIILSQAVKTASFDLFSHLLVARSEAITRNTTVTVTPAGGNWANGWTITDSGGETVRQQDRFAQVIIAGPGSITFNGAGRLTTGSTSLSLMANGGQASHNRCIEIDLGGRPASKKGAC
ncbi:MAG TPA: GspH/FimT family pseudopilin [Burkholderiales bacterium]|nr:GspH/FimT family pseudopilin [Burkholderiales bacterium]